MAARAARPRGRKEQARAKSFPPMSFINERKYSTTWDRACIADDGKASHRNRESEGLITCEVERGGAGERDTGGRAPAPLGTTDHGRAGVVCRSHGENSLKTCHIPPPVLVPLFVDRASGSLVTGSLGCLHGTPSFPSQGQAPLVLPRKIKELCVENAKAAIQGAGGQVR